MKLRCPRCQQKITVPDEWAGKAIRCTGCNKAFQIPKPQESSGPLPGEKDLDLASLANLEARSGGMGDEELAAAEAILATETATDEPPPRTCPNCQKQIKVKNPYVELLCSHCGKPIPALKKGLGFTTGRAVLVGATNLRSESKVGFYEGLGSATTYPLGAIGSLITAVLIAVGAILLPVGLMTSLARTTEQSDVGSLQGVTVHELTGLEKAMTVFFFMEVLFFVGVGVHAFIDVARATSIGEDKPPPLVWYPGAWGESLVGYLALLVYYGLFAAVAIMIANGGAFVIPSSIGQVKQWLTPTILTLAGLMTFFVPMNLLGLTVGKVMQAVNPVRLVKSILATHVNYVFLFLLVTVYMSMFVALFGMVLDWFGGQFRQLQRDTSLGNVSGVALGLVSWGAVMGLGFYGVYVLGRLHGLFARTFRKQLEFSS